MVVAGRSLIVIWGDVGEGNCNGKRVFIVLIGQKMLFFVVVCAATPDER